MRDVFISHSARGDAFATAVLERLVDGLATKNLRPLVDQDDIPPGNEWRPHVVDWLARCDAAVVLLNDKALSSDWVRREVNILMWRRALGAPVFVVPVLLGVPSTGVVKQAGLEELRPIQFARTRAGAAQDAEGLAGAVLARFADLPDAGPDGSAMSEWLDRLDTYLSEARRGDPLVKAATALGLPQKYLPKVTTQQGGCLFLAHQFLVAPPDRVEKALNSLAPTLSETTLRRLIRDLVATWVDAEAARKVLPPSGALPQEMTVLLNASRRGTAQQYILRATCGSTWGYEVQSVGDLPTGEDRVGERVRDWEQAVWVQFFDAVTEEDRILPDDLYERTHYLVIDKFGRPDSEFAEAVARLHGIFSWLIVLVTTGKAAPEDDVRAAFKNSVLLEPLLTESDEATAQLRNRRLKKLPEQLTRVD